MSQINCLSGKTVKEIRDQLLELAIQLGTRGHVDTKKVLAVALRDVVNLHTSRRPQEFLLCIKTIEHCISHLDPPLDPYIPALIRVYNKLLDKQALKPINVHLVLRSAMLHLLSAGPDAALADLNRKAKNFAKHPEVETLKDDLNQFAASAVAGSLDDSGPSSQVRWQLSQPSLQPSEKIRKWLDEFEGGQVPCGLGETLDLAAANAVPLPDEVWQEGVMSGVPVVSVLAKRRRSERRFDWVRADFGLLLTALECQPENAQVFEMIFENLGLAETLLPLLVADRVDLWLGLFWGVQARKIRSQAIGLYAAGLLVALTQLQVSAEVRTAAVQLLQVARDAGQLPECLSRFVR